MLRMFLDRLRLATRDRQDEAGLRILSLLQLKNVRILGLFTLACDRASRGRGGLGAKVGSGALLLLGSLGFGLGWRVLNSR